MSKPKKINPNKLPLTKADMKIAEAKWRDQLEHMKIEATFNATLLTNSVYMCACKRVKGFQRDDVAEVLEEATVIYNRIADPEDSYCIDDIHKELLEIDVEVTDTWK